jgi:hypothetical protein
MVKIGAEMAAGVMCSDKLRHGGCGLADRHVFDHAPAQRADGLTGLMARSVMGMLLS